MTRHQELSALVMLAITQDPETSLAHLSDADMARLFGAVASHGRGVRLVVDAGITSDLDARELLDPADDDKTQPHETCRTEQHQVDGPPTPPARLLLALSGRAGGLILVSRKQHEDGTAWHSNS
jgi:hypothetical protein